MTTDFSAVTAGDQLFLRTGHRDAHRVIVARVTKTQVILDNDRKYRISDGMQIGSSGMMGFFVPRLAPIDSSELLIQEASSEYSRLLRLVAEYATKVAAYGDPIAAEKEFDLDGFIKRANDAKEKLVAIQSSTAA